MKIEFFEPMMYNKLVFVIKKALVLFLEQQALKCAEKATAEYGSFKKIDWDKLSNEYQMLAQDIRNLFK
jgi:hypothetical protein